MATLKRILAGFYSPNALEGTVWRREEKFVTEFEPPWRAHITRKKDYEVFVFWGI